MTAEGYTHADMLGDLAAARIDVQCDDCIEALTCLLLQAVVMNVRFVVDPSEDDEHRTRLIRTVMAMGFIGRRIEAIT